MRVQKDKNLSNSERLQLRGKIVAFMSEHPGRAPFLLQAIDWIEATARWTSDSLSPTRTRFAFSAALIFLVAGGGTSYAAEAALPGDTLYMIKISVNEKIAGAVAISPRAHVRFDTQLAERRLQEAEVLAAAGRFSEQDREQLESHLSSATANFNTHLAALATSSESGALAAANAQSDLEATFTAHTQVLAAISSALPEYSRAVAPFEEAVHTHISAAREAREKLDDKMAASSSRPLAKTVQTSGEDAIEAAQIVEDLIRQTAASLGASTSAFVARRASDVEQSVAEGQAHVQGGRYEKALGSFNAAIRAAQETRATVQATEQLKKVMPALPLSDPAIHIGSSDEPSPIETSATDAVIETNATSISD